MTSSDLSNSFDSGLLGAEIGRNKVRLVLLDESGQRVIDLVERPIAKAGGPRDPIEQEQSTRAALEAALDRLGIVDGSGVMAAASIGFTNCGVGSGPALHAWLEGLSDEIGEPIVLAGDDGISYSPSRCVEFVQRVFDPTGVQLDRVELAPVAATRVVSHLRSGTLTLGSGVAWAARVLNDQVLEAFEAPEGPFDDVLHVIAGDVAEPLAALEGVDIDEQLCRNRGVPVAALAPAVGVAVSLLSSERTNLLEGQTVYGRVVASSAPGGGPVTGAGPDDDSPWSDAIFEEPVSSVAAEVFDEYGTDAENWSRRHINDTHQLRRLPESVEHSREYSARSESARGVETAQRSVPADELGGIEAFAHPTEARPGGLNVSDALLGALGMLAVVLAAALVLL